MLPRKFRLRNTRPTYFGVTKYVNSRFYNPSNIPIDVLNVSKGVKCSAGQFCKFKSRS